jgi:site-specific DNA recombinase
LQLRTPRGQRPFGTAANGRSKTYRYYTCWSRARYGTTTCAADRLNADAPDAALLANLAAFYRDQRDLIKAAANEADAARHTAIERHQAELTAVEKEITGGAEPIADDGTTVRTMGNPVGATGIEPVTARV